jgi:Flp pilus assembly protein TadG
MIMFKKSFKKFHKADEGIAAIETAFVLPLMVLLYFGLVDVTGLISFNRKITAAANLTSDLVGQRRTSILKAEIDDIYNATAMIMAPTPMSDVRVEVYGFRNVGGTVTQIWTTSNGQGPACSSASAMLPASMLPLMQAGNDLIVTRTCMNFTPYVAAFMGNSIMGSTIFPVNASISVRPRASLVLNCYTTTVAAGTLCS